MAEVGFWQSIVRDVTGHGMFGGKFQIRLVLQPLIGVVLGVRAGFRDARRGREPYFASLLLDHGKRLAILKEGLRGAIVPLCVAFLIDGILQYLILHHVRPVEAVIVGTCLVFVPFVFARELANRAWRVSHHRRTVRT